MNKVTDNVNHGFPARMSDGRFITNYWPNCVLNSTMKNEMSSFGYRHFLMNNAVDIIKNQNKLYKAEYGCEDCAPDFNVNPGSRYVQECSKSGCAIKEVEPKGIGIEQS